MKIAIVNSNNIKIGNGSKKGTEIFANFFIRNLAKRIQEEHLDLDITAYASGDSELPVRLKSVNRIASSLDKGIPDEKHIIFELALIAEAFSRQDEFDLFHINIGDGDIALPFAGFIKKPLLITIHNTKRRSYVHKYFSLFKNLTNVSYISISDAQRKFFPDLNYLGTIYHGIDIINNFTFDPLGGDAIMWAGRAIPNKGMDVVIEISKDMKKKAKLFPLLKINHFEWYKNLFENLQKNNSLNMITIKPDLDRLALVPEYQKSKLFLFPLKWEEPFGLVAIEAMACGTPVIAYARGSMPEIIKDGETGFLVNPTRKRKRGHWIIKKTGTAGLQEAIERIYAMPDKNYRRLRNACRKHVEKNFTVDRMVSDYIHAYEKIVNK